MENIVGPPQTVQVPNYSGVNIQIFNPTVAPQGTVVQPPAINTSCSTNPCYPANYYTQNYSNSNNTTNTTTPESVLTKTVTTVQSGNSDSSQSSKKTEVREIVELTDNYIKSLENYLNNPDKQVRLIGAKEVLARLQEDESRKDDPALNALLNKMLKDPYHPIKFIAMGAFEAKVATGNEESVNVLQQIQTQNTNMGEDSIKASNALLKMAGTTTTKEFEVHEKLFKNESKKK